MYINRCNTTIDAFEVAVMDGAKHHGGVRRSRAAEVTTADSAKRAKFNPPEPENAAAVVRLENRCRSGVDGDSPEDVASSLESGDRVSSSSCVQNDLSSDLKVEIPFETEASVCGNGGFSREASSSSEICLDSDEMESSSTLKKKITPLPTATSSRRQPSPAANIPSPAEIDEFFSVMEKKEQKRFADKYNYDIVNDVPMEGRYQWVRLKP